MNNMETYQNTEGVQAKPNLMDSFKRLEERINHLQQVSNFSELLLDGFNNPFPLPIPTKDCEDEESTTFEKELSPKSLPYLFDKSSDELKLLTDRLEKTLNALYDILGK